MVVLLVETFSKSPCGEGNGLMPLHDMYSTRHVRNVMHVSGNIQVEIRKLQNMRSATRVTIARQLYLSLASPPIENFAPQLLF